jgi:hypothetical protein
MNKHQDTIDNNPIIEFKKDWRRDNLATRIDLRMPNEVYDRVIEIAIASGEKINPKTSQVRVTATLNKLIEIGIRYYPEDNPTSSINIGRLSDSIGLEEKYQELSDKYRELESMVSDVNPILTEIKQDISGLKSVDIEEIVKTCIELTTGHITNSITELETYVRSRFEELETRPVEKPAPIPTKPTDDVNKTWFEFFKMVGIDALTATEAQKKDNIDIRTEQIARGIQAAKEQSLGEWAVKVAGRSFVRVGD